MDATPPRTLAQALGQLRERRIGAILLLDAAQAAIEASRDIPDHVATAAAVRSCAGELLEQGVGARQVSAWISEVNDSLTRHLLQLAAREEGLDLARACWLVFGSQGRAEQTLVTDQDNGLVFDSDAPQRDRPAWLRLGQRVNQALDACGYASCRGLVMAGAPACCLSVAEWQQRFSHWMDHGAPEDLLKACIFFDLRAVAGRLELALPLREHLSGQAGRVPRFLKQMADNALRNAVPLGWLGSIESRRVQGRAMLNLKQQGTMLFVDAARLFALAHGIAATGTRERFEAAAPRVGAPAHEALSWAHGFEFLQNLRLRAQLAPAGGPGGGTNMVDLEALDDLDRRMLKETLKVAQRLHQRMELDYQR